MQSLTFNIVLEEALQYLENQETCLSENGTCDSKRFLPGVHWCVETGQWWLIGQTIGWAGGAWGQWGLRNRHSLAWTLHLAIWGVRAIWQIANIMPQTTGSKYLGYDTDCTRVDFFNEFKDHHFWSHHFLLIYFAANLGGHWICKVSQKKTFHLCHWHAPR